MQKEQLLKLVATAGYDVGFGAKTHFATLDIIEKAPGWLAFASLAGGVYSLFVPFWATQHPAAVFVLFGIVSLYIGYYTAEKARYEQVGKQLTQYFHELHVLFRKVESLAPGADASAYLPEFERIRADANAVGLSKQIFMSDWYAHYKFFWQTQIDWIDSARPFDFFRDKIPLSAYLALVALIVALGAYEREPTGKAEPAAVAKAPCSAQEAAATALPQAPSPEPAATPPKEGASSPAKPAVPPSGE